MGYWGHFIWGYGLSTAVWAPATWLIRGIQTHHKSRALLVANALGQNIGGGFGGRSSHQHSPHRRTAGMENQPGGSILAFERGAHSLGAALIQERAGLDCIPILGGGGGGGREDDEPDARDSWSDESDGAGGGVRKIDDAVFDEGPAVGNADVDRFVVGEIHHAHPSTEGQRAMRGSEAFHVVDFAVRGGAAVIRMPVPARETGFAVSDFTSDHVWRRRRGGGAGVLLRATSQR